MLSGTSIDIVSETFTGIATGMQIEVLMGMVSVTSVSTIKLLLPILSIISAAVFSFFCASRHFQMAPAAIEASRSTHAEIIIPERAFGLIIRVQHF
ncbi:hypothetical protein SDC9_49642 [bioreactor metagenome]|uniref:Uncharacterized protein n=1 Tax=bioreactor metagenome TaxID=1076179 RepID=A0A644WHM9_9ZZZZ